MSTFIVGDELHFQGYRVAILTTDAPPTVIGEFENQINNGTLFEADKYQCSECNAEGFIPHLHDCSLYEKPKKPNVVPTGGDTEYDCCLDDVQRVAKEYARGGLLKLTDLAKLCQTLKESAE